MIAPDAARPAEYACNYAIEIMIMNHLSFIMCENLQVSAGAFTIGSCLIILEVVPDSSTNKSSIFPKQGSY